MIKWNKAIVHLFSTYSGHSRQAIKKMSPICRRWWLMCCIYVVRWQTSLATGALGCDGLSWGRRSAGRDTMMCCIDVVRWQTSLATGALGCDGLSWGKRSAGRDHDVLHRCGQMANKPRYRSAWVRWALVGEAVGWTPLLFRVNGTGLE